jgi:ectoine hydroxylase-related dioxygenase (phytanoyl-CoA dioxygenase family)
MITQKAPAATTEMQPMPPEQLAAAVAAVKREGFVVVEDVIDGEHVAALREKMLADLPLILAREDAPFNWHAGNVQHDPPPLPPYLFRDVLLNDQVIAVTKAILGAGLKNSYYSGNTAMPGGKEQPVHVDTGQLWPDLEHPTPPYGLVVNVPVVDMSRENGSTELWPGTHHDTTVFIQQGDIKIPMELVEKRRQVLPPIQPSVRAGSVLIRDIRLWHRGMPNHTDQPRPMIAMIHWVSWWSTGGVAFPKGTEAFFEHPELRTSARFVEAPIDYIHHSHAYEYEKEG